MIPSTMVEEDEPFSVTDVVTVRSWKTTMSLSIAFGSVARDVQRRQLHPSRALELRMNGPPAERRESSSCRT